MPTGPFPRANEILVRVDAIRAAMIAAGVSTVAVDAQVKAIVNGSGQQLFPQGNATGSSAFLSAFEVYPQVAEQVLTIYEAAESGIVADANFSEIQHEMILPTLLGKNNYRIPVGSYFASGTPISLEIDQGAGYIPQDLGPDYSELGRVTPPPTVADLKLGYSLAGGPIAAGWSMRFRWVERQLRMNVGPLAKVKLVGGVPDYANPWNQSSTPDHPNGVRIPEMAGMQVEFWRYARKNGGKRGGFGVLHRDGRRFVPYFRGPVNQFLFTVDDFRPTSHSLRYAKFRVCYVDPVTQARSPLSTDEIIVCARGRDDRTNMGAALRAANSVWIQ